VLHFWIFFGLCHVPSSRTRLLGLCRVSALAQKALLVYVSALTCRGLYHVIGSAALANRTYVFFTHSPTGVAQLHKSVNATILNSVRRRVFITEYQAAVVRRWKVAGGVPSQGRYFKGGLVKCRLLWKSYGVFRAREGVESRQRMRNYFSTLTFKKIKYLDPHVPLCLLGRFKGERGERYHILPIAWVTDSGIHNGRWFSRLVRSLQRKHKEHGAVFSDRQGKRKHASSFEPGLFEALDRVQVQMPGIISASVNIPEDCGISRTLRRSATTRARLAKVPEADIDANNRWRTVEAAQGRAPAHRRIRDHYSQISLMLEVLLRFSQAL